MKTQVVCIHGGCAFSDYARFLKTLQKTWTVDPYEQKQKRWRETLPQALGEEYEVFLPQMPNKQNAKYEEWKIWFEKYVSFLHDDVFLIGHSLGGYFLVKYLLENQLPVSVRGLFLIAAPARRFTDDSGEDGGDFHFDANKLPQLANKARKIAVFHSTDDPVVPYEHALVYTEVLPDATLHHFEDRGHFLQGEFPELVEEVRRLG